MGCNATAIHEYLIIKMHYLNSHSPWAPALAQSTSLTLICPWVAVGLYHCSGFNMNRGSNARERGWFHRAVRPLQLKCDKKNMHFLIAFNTSPVVLEDAGPDRDIPSSERKTHCLFVLSRPPDIWVLSAACLLCHCILCCFHVRDNRLWWIPLNYLLLWQMAHLSLTGIVRIHCHPDKIFIMTNSDVIHSFWHPARSKWGPEEHPKVFIEFLHHHVFKWCIKI